MQDAITPQMYGAKADGKADDTESFQKAVDSGFDVYVPTAMKETYRITKPIRITKSGCKRIFSEPMSRSADSGAIIFDLTEKLADQKTIPLLDVHMQLLHISGLRIVSRAVNGHRAGIMINAMDSICDYDIQIDHCDIHNFYKAACFKGRGFEITDSKVGSCQYLAEFHWDDAEDTNSNHPPEYDQRGIAVRNNRLHNMASGFLIVKSGHAYGLHFEGNTVDNGRGRLVRAYEQAWGWNISGNVIQGIQGDFDFMDFRKGMRNCLICGNTFLSDDGYWIGSEGTVGSWLKCGGSTSNSIISNNVFKNGRFMTFKNLTGSAINGNVMQGDGTAITVTGNCSKNAVTGNACTGNIKLISKQIQKGNAVTGNVPNE